jgi:hypothetical protein
MSPAEYGLVRTVRQEGGLIGEHARDDMRFCIRLLDDEVRGFLVGTRWGVKPEAQP